MIPALMPNYNRCDVALERGEGAYGFTADGTRYLDFMAGIAVNCLGHAHPRLVAALKSQAEKITASGSWMRIGTKAHIARATLRPTRTPRVAPPSA